MKRVTIYLLFLVQIIFQEKLYGQGNIHTDSVPKEYSYQYKEDEERYWQYIRYAAESSGKAFNLWQSAIKGNWKRYNLDSLKLVFDSLRRKEFLRTIEFIKQNPNSYSSLVNFKRLLFPRMGTDTLLSIYGFFSKDLRSTPLASSVYMSIKRKQLLRLNAEVPLFSFKTNDGYNFNLSSFRNKQYVLLCFWASWCDPCIRNIPFLKVIEQEYRLQGLQVVSVSIDDESKKWLDAVEKYSMPWLQSCDLPPYITDAKVRSLYELDFIPQYFLIDKEGKLIYQNILSMDNDEHDALKQMLEKVLY